jgi:hypothetical protein
MLYKTIIQIPTVEQNSSIVQAERQQIAEKNFKQHN